MLKARYFKQSEFLNVSMGSNPFFPLDESVVGRGDKIQIYRSKWIPKPASFRPFSVLLLPAHAKVAELIDAENQWKTDFIHQHFIKEDAEAIMRIPLPRNPKSDEVCRHFDDEGMFTVKCLSSGTQIISIMICLLAQMEIFTTGMLYGTWSYLRILRFYCGG